MTRTRVGYDENGRKVITKLDVSQLLSVLSSFHYFRLAHSQQSNFKVEEHVGTVVLPSRYKLEPKCFLSSTAISLEQFLHAERNAPHNDGILTVDAPDWLILRNHYFQRLEQAADQILEEHESNVPITPILIRDFLSMLRVLRIVFIRMLQCKQRQGKPVTAVQVQEQRALDDGIESIPQCLDFLDVEPFRSITHVQLTLNPFIATHNLVGDLAISVNNNVRQLRDATSDDNCLDDRNDIDFDENGSTCPYVPKLVSLLHTDLQYTLDEFSQFVKFYDMLKRLSEVRHQHAFMSVKSQRLQERLNQQRERELSLHRLEVQVDCRHCELTMQRVLRAWRRRLIIVRRLKRFMRKRRRRIKRAVLRGLCVNIVREQRLERLRRRHRFHIKSLVMDCWKALVIWCKHYRDLRKRCLQGFMQHCIDQWRKYVVFESTSSIRFEIVDMDRPFSWLTNLTRGSLSRQSTLGNKQEDVPVIHNDYSAASYSSSTLVKTSSTGFLTKLIDWLDRAPLRRANSKLFPI